MFDRAPKLLRNMAIKRVEGIAARQAAKQGVKLVSKAGFKLAAKGLSRAPLAMLKVSGGMLNPALDATLAAGTFAVNSTRVAAGDEKAKEDRVNSYRDFMLQAGRKTDGTLAGDIKNRAQIMTGGYSDMITDSYKDAVSWDKDKSTVGNLVNKSYKLPMNAFMGLMGVGASVAGVTKVGLEQTTGQIGDWLGIDVGQISGRKRAGKILESRAINNSRTDRGWKVHEFLTRHGKMNEKENVTPMLRNATDRMNFANEYKSNKPVNISSKMVKDEYFSNVSKYGRKSAGDMLSRIRDSVKSGKTKSDFKFDDYI